MRNSLRTWLDEIPENSEACGVLVTSVSSQSAQDARLFDSAFLAKLERLHLIARRLFHGQRRAERRSRRTGSSLEFADYRNYSHGDDLRNIDWNIYGRLDRLFLKLFEEEEDLPVHILVDASASMRWGTGEKFDFARRVAAALAYIALAGLEQVNTHFFAERLFANTGNMRGRLQFHKILTFLSQPPAQGHGTSLAEAVQMLARGLRQRGILIVISDLLDADGYEKGLQMARHQGFDVRVVQVLHPQEIEPDFLGDWSMEDSETGVMLEVTTNEETLVRYRTEMAVFFRTLERFCRSREIGYVRARSDTAFEEVALEYLRRGGLVK